MAERSENPSHYPRNGTYADLLFWHMEIWGTREGGDKIRPGKRWEQIDFLKKVYDENVDTDAVKRNLINWRGGGSTPDPLTLIDVKIENALFGDNPLFDDWKVDLRLAYARSKGPGKNPRTVFYDDGLFQGDNLDAAGSINVAGRILAYLKLHNFRGYPTNLNELLRTDIRATTFVGRNEELTMLRNWLGDQRAIAVKCLVGDAGAGKTRLAIELCELAEKAGWFASFVPSSALLGTQVSQSSAGQALARPALLVIDYAATCAVALKGWLRDLAPLQNNIGSRLRILLLERQADLVDGWWANLQKPDSLTRASSADLISTETPYVLRPIDGIRNRRALIEEVMVKAAPLFVPPRPPLIPPEIGTDPAFDRRLADDAMDNGPLFLAMAGIWAVESGAPAALAMNRIELAQRIAMVEEERLGRFAVARGFTDNGKLLKHIVACVTLQNGCDPGGLTSMIREERKSLEVLAAIDDEGVAEAVCDFLPVVDKVEGVRPDLIGEAFCLSIVKGGRVRKESVQHELVLRCWKRDSGGTLDTLVRCARDFAEGSPEHISIKYLNAVMEDCRENVEQLSQIASAVPISTLALSEFALESYSTLTELLQPLANTDPVRWRPSLAVCMDHRSVRLKALGQIEEALEVSQQALELWRSINIDDPGSNEKDLANSLIGVSELLNIVGRCEDAISVANEAIVIFRNYLDSDSGFSASTLAGAISVLSGFHVNMGNFKIAHDLLGESIQILRGSEDLKHEHWKSYYASTLDSFASCLDELGNSDQSFLVWEEATALYRTMAAECPDAELPSFAQALCNWSIALRNKNRNSESLRAAREAVDIFRKLSFYNPQKFEIELADSLRNLSVSLIRLDMIEEAVQASIEDVQITKSIMSSGRYGSDSDMAFALSTYSLCLHRLGKDQEALPILEEEIVILENILDSNPKSYTGRLIFALGNAANIYSGFGFNQKALEFSEKAVAIARRCPDTDSNKVTTVLANSLSNLSLFLSNAGRRREALRAAEESVGLFKVLAATNPDDLIMELAHSFENLAIRLNESEQPDEAIAAAENALTIWRQLTESLPEQYTPDLDRALSLMNELRKGSGLAAPQSRTVSTLNSKIVSSADRSDADKASSVIYVNFSRKPPG